MTGVLDSGTGCRLPDDENPDSPGNSRRPAPRCTNLHPSGPRALRRRHWLAWGKAPERSVSSGQPAEPHTHRDWEEVYRLTFCFVWYYLSICLWGYILRTDYQWFYSPQWLCCPADRLWKLRLISYHSGVFFPFYSINTIILGIGHTTHPWLAPGSAFLILKTPWEHMSFCPITATPEGQQSSGACWGLPISQFLSHWISASPLRGIIACLCSWGDWGSERLSNCLRPHGKFPEEQTNCAKLFP